MKEKSIKIPLFFAILPIVYLVVFSASAPTKQFVEGVVASSTAAFMDPIGEEVQEEATNSTAHSLETASTTESRSEVDVVIASSSATSTETTTATSTTGVAGSTDEIMEMEAIVASSTATSTTDNVSTSTPASPSSPTTSGQKEEAYDIFIEEVVFESEPIEAIQKAPEPNFEVAETDGSLYRIEIEEYELESPDKCQTGSLSRKYKNPGECIRAWRESRDE